jgi:RNase P subunit RPR2
VAAEVQRLQTLRQADEEERDRLLAQRQQDETTLPPEILELYERVRKARRGLALAEARDGCCTACNVRLRPQVYNEVRTNESVVTCESCSRILYYVEQPVPIMQTVCITREDFDKLKQLHEIHLWDWPAVFSTNCHREIWSPPGRGYTHGQDREELRGLSNILDAVADAYISVRPEGGRFFIGERGAFYKTEDLGGPEEPFMQFQISG